jgi:hypothetical protein
MVKHIGLPGDRGRWDIRILSHARQGQEQEKKDASQPGGARGAGRCPRANNFLHKHLSL